MEVCLICTNITIDRVVSVFDTVDVENNAKITDILFDLNYKICVEETGTHSICYKCYMNLIRLYNFRDACSIFFECEQSLFGCCQLCLRKTNEFKLFSDSALKSKSLTVLEMLNKICSYDFSLKYNGNEYVCRKCFISCIENYMFHVKCEKATEYWIDFILNKNNIFPRFQSSKKRGKFNCSICPKEFSSNRCLTLHLRKHNGKNVFYCYICMKGYISKRQLIDHMETHNGLPKTKKVAARKDFLCEICSKTFSTKGLLKMHKSVHSDQKPHKCHLCPKSYKNISGFKRHMFKHTGEKPFMCEKCSKTFADYGCLKLHYVSHSEEYSLECNICFRRFKHKNTLNGHKREVHIGERRHKCELCSKAFTTKRHLENHRQTHNTEKTFKCPHCFKLFLSNRYLTRHMHLQHSGRRKYHKCELCSKEFTTGFGLRTHLTNKVCQKEIEGSFHCEICSKEFKQLRRLQTHQQEAHFDDGITGNV